MINQIEPWIGSSEVQAVTECISSTFVTEESLPGFSKKNSGASSMPLPASSLL